MTARILLGLFLLSPLSMVQAAPSFTITLFNSPGGFTDSFAYGINAQGDVVGSGKIGDTGNYVPYVYTNGSINLLPGSGSFDDAVAISDSGLIVGYSNGVPSSYTGGVWTSLTATDIPGDVTSINNSGTAVGSAFFDDFPDRHATLYAGGTATDLGTLLIDDGGRSEAYAINDAGDAVGMSETSDGDHHAVLFKDGMIVDLGTLGGDTSGAHDINDLGHIVGHSETAFGDERAFLFKNGVMLDLGTVGGYEISEAFGINNLGHVVGTLSMYSGYAVSLFYYDGTTMWDVQSLLPDLASIGLSSLGSPFDVKINDAGQIVGTGFDLMDNRVGYVLTPTAVPEPGAWAAITIAGLAVVILARRRAA